MSYLRLLGCFCAVWMVALGTVRGATVTMTYSNTTAIAVNETNPPTIAAPYPSSIAVTNLSNQVVTKVTVTLRNFSHSSAGDVSALLVGPQGQVGILMTQVGGQTQVYGATNVTLTFDDTAINSLPINSFLTSGTFKPTAGSLPLDYAFPTPAPANNSNAPCTMSVFTNGSPGGTWSLFVDTDAVGDSGSIAGGWSLSIMVVQPTLAIAHVPPNDQFSWPSTNLNYQLQSNTNLLNSNSWANVTNNPVVISNRFVVSLPISTNGNKFFRLISY